MAKVSLYNLTYYRNESLKNLGFDYKDVLIRKTSSNYLFKNINMDGFLKYINDIMVHHIENVKYIRTFFNYTVPYNYKKIN